MFGKGVGVVAGDGMWEVKKNQKENKPSPPSSLPGHTTVM